MRPPTRGRRLLPLVAALAAAGCARVSRPSGSDGPASDLPAPAAAVGDARVSKGELSDFLFDRFRETWLEALDDLVDERIVALERARLGVVVPAAAVDAAVETEAKARAEQLHARFGDGADLASSVKAYYGLDVDTWKRTVLRPRLEARLALQRVVRLSARTREQVVVRVIVKRDRAAVEALRAKVERGADFSLTALQESEDPSKSLGGVVPPLARGDLPLPAVEEALFAAAPGSLVGPLEVPTPAGPEYHLYRVVEKAAAWTGTPDALAARLEADLSSNPVTRAEYERWSARVRRAYAVRYFAPDGSVLRLPAAGR